MATLECLTHGVGSTDAFKTVVGPTSGQFDDLADDIIAVCWIDKVRHAKAFTDGFLVVVQIDTDNHVRADHSCALENIQADSTEPKNNDVSAGLHFGGVDHRTNAGCDATTDITDFFKRCVFAYFRERDFWQNRMTFPCNGRSVRHL